MESALSPNTAAFLDYLSTQLNGNADPDMSGSIDSVLKGTGSNNNATSLPPSAFFQVPDIKPVVPTTSLSASLSPPNKSDQSAGRSVSVSGSEGDSPVIAGNGVDKGAIGADGLHKRKAGLSHTVEEEYEEDDSESDAPAGHEDKRQHQNDKPKKGGRKSGAGDEERPGKEMSKAARRKEQNRAAQKAFRERREARVSDLEAKVAELENKSFSSTVENENLRSILKRLQEENVRLKQSAFTFAMPRAGSTSNSSPTDPRVPSPVQRTGSKPLTPPSSTDEPLKSVNEVPPVGLPHRTSSSGMSGSAASPESLKSVGSSNSSRNILNGNSPMRFDSFSNFSTETGITPPSVSSENKSDFDALWASFYPPNANANGNGQQQAGQVPTGNQSGFTQQQYQAALASPNPLSQFLASQMAQGKFQPQDLQPQPQSQPNMAYRDPSGEVPGQDWSAANNTSIDDFLASLNGTNTTDDNPVTSADDDLFNQQLQQMLAGSNFDNTTFSPTNYLNMSPSPLNSLSNSTSPQSAQVSGASYSASPESSNASSAPPKELPAQSPCPAGSVVNVVDANGNLVKPSDLWVKMGMQHQDNVDNLLIDDLCDQMRAKAKCHDGTPQLNISDVEHMMKWEKTAPKPAVDSKEKFNWGAVFSGQHH